MDKKLLSFSIDEIENVKTLEEINDSQFSKIRIRAFSDGVTRHGYGFTLNTIKESAFTILGKPILFKYDMWTDDASSHEPEEVQCGFVPKDEKDADIQFEYDEVLNKTFLTVNAYLWNVYQEDLIRILQRDDGYKNVSVEMWVIDSDETSKKDRGYITVNKFVYNGITILGSSVTEACEGADMEVIKFSYDDYQRAQLEFEKKLNNSINQESDQDSFLIQKNSENKEETMAKEVKNTATDTPEVLENGEKISTVNVNVSEYTDNYDDNGNYVGSTSEYHSKSETKVEHTDENTTAVIENAVEDEEKQKVDNSVETNETPEQINNSSEDFAEKYNALEVKCSTLETELLALKNSYSSLELKCASLEEYKNNKENEEKTIAIECALNDVVGILSTDEISQWREKSLTCSTVDAFKNELKAFAFDVQKRSGTKAEETLRNSIPLTQVEEPTNVWDRLAKTI